MTKSNKIAKGGLYSALSIALIYLSTILPSNTLTILVLCSTLICLSIITIGVKHSFLVYIISCMMSWFLGAIYFSLSYVFIFGIYAFIKYSIEKINNAYVEILLKFVYFTISALVIYLILSAMSIKIPLKFGIPIMYILYIIGAVIYDYCLTILIAYFSKRFKL